MTIQKFINLGAGSSFVTGLLPIVSIAPGSQDQVLVTSGGVPAWSQITSNNIFASTIPISKLAAGSNNQVLMSDGISDFFGQISDGYVSSSANIAGSKIAPAGISTFGVIKLNGDLGGTGASPTVVGISGSAGIVTLNLTTVQYLDTITAPIFKQLGITSVTTVGQPLTIKAQDSTGSGSTGGILNLSSGLGNTAPLAGIVNIQSGGVTIASINDSKFITSKGIRRSVTLITTNYTVLTSDDIIAAGTLSAGITVTLPSSPIMGDAYSIKDTVGTASTNNITIAGNGHNIDGASTFVITEDRGGLTVFFDSSGWSVL